MQSTRPSSVVLKRAIAKVGGGHLSSEYDFAYNTGWDGSNVKGVLEKLARESTRVRLLVSGSLLVLGAILLVLGQVVILTGLASGTMSIVWPMIAYLGPPIMLLALRPTLHTHRRRAAQPAVWLLPAPERDRP